MKKKGKINKQWKLEMITTALVFSFIVSISLINMGGNFMTGHVVLDNPEEGQIILQEILRFETLQEIGTGAKICIVVKNGQEDTFYYKVRKVGNAFNIIPSGRYCDGKELEDFVFSFENPNILESLKESKDISSLINTRINDNFKVWESKYVKTTGLVSCDEEFKTKYCKFLKKNFPQGMLNMLGISCCNEVDIEEPKQDGWLFSLIKRFWWLIGIIFIGLALGGGTIVLLGTKDETISEESLDEVIDYIKKMRNSNFGDKVINEKLIEIGWETEVVKKAFDKIRKEHLSNIQERFEKINLNGIFKKK